MNRHFASSGFLALAGVAALVSLAALAAPEPAKEPARVTLAIEGMHCGGCAAAVKSALKNAEGVTGYEVSLEQKEAEVRFDPAKTSPEKIAAAVSKTGFKATVKAEKEGPVGQ